MTIEPQTLGDAVLEPVRMLARTARHWLPVIVALSMVGKVPEIAVEVFAPKALSSIGGLAGLDLDLLFSGAFVVLVLYLFKLLIELVALMLAFGILADLSAGREPALGPALRRMASWKLQFTWLLGGFLEQIAISLWFVGGCFLLVPFGFVTTAAYEEENGLAAFGRSLRLGLGERGVGPGMRVAVPVTVGFAVAFVVGSLVSLASCAVSTGPSLMNAYALVTGGDMSLDGLTPPAYTSWDAAKDLALAPFGMLSTVYMMTAQQLGYWRARREAGELDSGPQH